MKKIFVLTGAGISKESGIPTFRDSVDVLWHNYNIEEVASPAGWKKNPELVLNFYNERRAAIAQCIPNEAHYALAKLQEHFDVRIYTQNIDDLHERAGSKNVFHIHGNITQARSVLDENNIIDIGYNDIKIGDVNTDGGQLRPHVVFFDEFICYEQEAEIDCRESDIVVVVGTSLQVYPAARFPNFRKQGVPMYVINPEEMQFKEMFEYKSKVTHINKIASEGMKDLTEILLKEYTDVKI